MTQAQHDTERCQHMDCVRIGQHLSCEWEATIDLARYVHAVLNESPSALASRAPIENAE